MILIDANLLIYAHAASVPQHGAARDWFDRALNRGTPVGLPWPSLLAFMRIVSNPRAFVRPEPVESAWRQVEEWLDCPSVWIPQPTDRHRQILAGLLADTHGGNLVADAHLAALAIEHGLTLCSTDGDFARFAALRWENPLRSPPT